MNGWADDVSSNRYNGVTMFTVTLLKFDSIVVIDGTDDGDFVAVAVDVGDNDDGKDGDNDGTIVSNSQLGGGTLDSRQMNCRIQSM